MSLGKINSYVFLDEMFVNIFPSARSTREVDILASEPSVPRSPLVFDSADFFDPPVWKL